ncbi:MAG: NAD(P)/FAD-dependent oxidoreductase [Gammaproteobacteria bacterium]
MTQHCIIVGGGHAAAALAPELRQQGWQGDITVVCGEPHIPYQRPPLSKEFLAGDKGLEDIYIRPSAVYEQAKVQLLLNTQVTAVDRDNKRVQLSDGSSPAYSKLALTLGARVRTVDLPGVELQGISYLRNLADVQRIRQSVKSGGRAVIVGGGYIGLETAAVLNRLGMQVTVVEMQDRVLQRVTAPQVSAFYSRIHREAGVTIRCNTGITAFAGNGKVEKVLCSDGTELSADLVVIGVGILPETELAEAAGLEVENGIKVNSRTQTSDPDIYAAGDCTCHPNPIYDRWLRLESVQNASEQARITAMSICDKPADYKALPWFWSDQYDLKLQIAGLSQGFDQLVIRGDIEQGRSFAAFYLQQDKIIAVDAVNKAAEFMFGKKLISRGAVIDTNKLANAAVPLKELL